MAEAILNLAANPPQDPLERKALHNAARKLMYSTESNHDVQHRIYYGGFPLYMANIAIDLGIFKALAEKDGKPCSPFELAKQLSCEELLLTRVLRGLVAYGLADSHPDGTYSSNATTLFFSQPGREAGVMHNVLTVMPSLQKFPDFLQQHGKKCPTSGNDTGFQMAFDTDEDLFTYLGSHPRDLNAAIGLMAAQRADQVGWIRNEDVFPTQDLMLSDQDVEKGRILLVDVGGGSGHQSIAFRTEHPECPGPIMSRIYRTPSTSLTKTKWRSSASNPVRGAKVYYLRNVLHDWPDDVCLTILRQLRPAMAEDSVLIIDDAVVAGDVPRWHQVNYDWVMMSVCGSLERTRQQWAELFDAAGYSLREVREYDADKGDSLVIGTPA